MLKSDYKDDISQVRTPTPICSWKKFENLNLPKRVKHPFQVINISPYPFWIGFSLFAFICWFGFFFLNADWVKTGLSKTIFDIERQFLIIYYSTSFGSWDCVENILGLFGATSKDWIGRLHFSNQGLSAFNNVVAYSRSSNLPSFLSGSSIVFYFIKPLLYFIQKALIPGLVSILKGLNDIFSGNLILDISEYFKTGHSEFKGLRKYGYLFLLILPFGCPFRIFTTSIGYASIFYIAIFPITFTLYFLDLFFNVIFYWEGGENLFSFFLVKIFSIPVQIFWGFLLLWVLVLKIVISPLPLIVLLAAGWRWMSDISIEGSRGEHTQAVQKNLLWGAYLFMLTEIIIFITLFQTTGYFLINPSVETSELWKFPGVHPPYMFGLGLANLILLLNSGWILQIARKRLNTYYDFLYFKRGGKKREVLFYRVLEVLIDVTKKTNLVALTNLFKKLHGVYSFDNRIKKEIGIEKIERGVITTQDRYYLNRLIKNCANYILKTIILGTIFMIFQFIEYSNLTFSISSGIYGTCFYCLTGLHGFHVIVGLILLGICWWQFYTKKFALDESVFFWFSVRYWQFVDFVWVIVWILFYFDRHLF